MAYIGKSIESGTFSVLDTSGNTYNGSNTTFNLGTQVGSVAQLLVSHDGVIQKPGTDYTLASGGTQITFTTAPASGASIFIVEISGAVGGPLNGDLNGGDLILDVDGDTFLENPNDDQIDFHIGDTNAERFTFDTVQFRTQREGTNQIKIANTQGTPNVKSGEIFFIGKDSAGLETNYSKIGGGFVTTTNGSEDGQLVFTVMNSATETDSLTINQTGSKFNVGAYHPEATLTDASTISWNVYTSPVAKVTLGANRTLGAATGAQTGQFVSLLIIQDGTGSRTVTFNAVYEFKDDTAPTLTTTAAKGDLFVFRYNGSKFLEVGRNQNLTLS
jgi:hypothetical protein